MGDVATLNRTLEQELFALLRGASLECLVCGEFVQHRAGGTIACPSVAVCCARRPLQARGYNPSVQAG